MSQNRSFMRAQERHARRLQRDRIRKMTYPSEDFSKTTRDSMLLTIGIGDAFALSGAAVFMSRQSPIVYPCQTRYDRTIKSLFINHPDVRVVTLGEAQTIWKADPDSPTAGGTRLVLNEMNDRPIDMQVEMYQFIYEQSGVPYTERWDSCPISEAVKHVKQKPVPDGPYAFIHDKAPQHAIDMNRVPWVKDMAQIYPTWEVGESMLAFHDLIVNATECHVANSAFWWFVEHSRAKGKLFAHWYCRPYIAPWQMYSHRKNWTFFL
jgi:hypothetical protein